MPGSLRRNLEHSPQHPPQISSILLSRVAASEPTLSYEFFPPKDDLAEQVLWSNFDRLLETKPDFVSVTYGAGGSNRERSLKIVDRMAAQVPTIGHLTCVSSSTTGTTEIIHDFENSQVAAILALRGDEPKDQPGSAQAGELKTALDLVKLTHQVSNLEVGVAAFPEVHPESPNLAHDAKVLKLKQDAGATFAITQLFFTIESYRALLEANDAAGVTIPIIPGLMPISNVRQVLRMAELSGAKVPSSLLQKFDSIHNDDQAREVGMAYSAELGNQLIDEGAPGLHIFTLNQHLAAMQLASSTGLCR
ncbi:MAG: methylenetetrahydrofolate reductase [Rhodoluna sp.]